MIAILACYFNPAGYASHLAKFETWRRHLPAGAHVVIVEASFDGRFVTGTPHTIKATAENLLWQKERLLNLALAKLEPKYDRVVWMDTDLIPFSPVWLEDAEAMLKRYPVGQPWSKIHFLDPQWRIERTAPSMCYRLHHRTIKDYACPGGLWAARREVLKHGLIDLNILGGGDAMQLAAWTGQFYKHFLGTVINKEWDAAFQAEAKRQYPLVRGVMGTCETEMLHIFHGTRQARQYVDRYQYLKDYAFDPRVHLEIDSNGLWKWSKKAPQGMRDGVRQYFLDRREDDWPVMPTGPAPAEAKK